MPLWDIDYVKLVIVMKWKDLPFWSKSPLCPTGKDGPANAVLPNICICLHANCFPALSSPKPQHPLLLSSRWLISLNGLICSQFSCCHRTTLCTNTINLPISPINWSHVNLIIGAARRTWRGGRKIIFPPSPHVPWFSWGQWKPYI